MKPILYYSEYCQYSNSIIQALSQTSIKECIHFINIDKRIIDNGNILILLDNHSRVPLPSSVSRVPTLIYKDNQNKVHTLVGQNIKNYIFEKINEEKEKHHVDDVIPYVFQSVNNFVHSDYYSFLDQDADEMSAKGNGGLRQMYNYANYNCMQSIETPNEDYIPDTIKDIKLENIIAERDQDINVQITPNTSVMPR